MLSIHALSGHYRSACSHGFDSGSLGGFTEWKRPSSIKSWKNVSPGCEAGGTTGHRGLVLGAYVGSVDEVQYVTFTGFDSRYFKESQMRLVNVVRVDGRQERSDFD